MGARVLLASSRAHKLTVIIAIFHTPPSAPTKHIQQSIFTVNLRID